MSCLHCAAALPFIIAGIVDLTGAQAASLRVGDTVQIVHDVQGPQSSDQAWSSKAEGEDVYENELIRTKVERQARISARRPDGSFLSSAAAMTAR
jgi:hypothetical protein